MRLEFFDFFSGCGGTSCGMEEAGMEVRFGLDSDPDAGQTFMSNFRKAKFIRSDIQKVSAREIEPFTNPHRGRPRVFGACAPCQPFSLQSGKVHPDDNRRNLLGEFHRFVEFFLPEYIFVENVPGLQIVGGVEGPFMDFIALLDRLGYYVRVHHI